MKTTRNGRLDEAFRSVSNPFLAISFVLTVRLVGLISYVRDWEVHTLWMFVMLICLEVDYIADVCCMETET